MFHLLAYDASLAGVPSTNADLAVVTEPVIGNRNNHAIFTDQFNLGMAYAISNTLISARLNSPTLNAYFRHMLWPLDLAAANPPAIVDRPALISYLSSPIALPQNEEIAWEISNAAAGAERAIVLNWLFTPDHSFQVPNGIQRLTCQATYSIAVATVGVWTGPGALTFAQNLRGGWYSVVGMGFTDPNTPACRLIFPRAKQYNGRILRPGCMGQATAGKRPDPVFFGRLGAWGKFHSFEPVQVEILSNTVATQAGTVYLDLVFHGDQEPLAY